ncbi:BASS family bile acid:Na+ symporter [Massilia sp. UYP11]|uniref:bile acid:sodium symporter family protein n=1 Tax=Massilia sp. UYP11 TaxID=1756385 RepID=UPI003D246DF4
MEVLKEIWLPALQGSLMLLVLAVGLDATMREAAFVLRQARLLARSLLAFAVAVPAFAALVVAAMPLERPVKIAILLMAVSPLPPLMPGKEVKSGGRRRYVYGLLVAVSLLAVALVPITVAILARVFGEEVSISPWQVLRVILASVIAPLALGMVIRHFVPDGARRAAPFVTRLANVMLVVTLLPLLFRVLPTMWQLVGNGTLVAMIVVLIGALLAGHVIGRRSEPHDQQALAVACTMRHPGMALVIAHANFTEPEISAAILMFLIVGMLVGLPYQGWYKRHRLAPQ